MGRKGKGSEEGNGEVEGWERGEKESTRKGEGRDGKGAIIGIYSRQFRPKDQEKL